MLRTLIAMLLALAGATPAMAGWKEAASSHFLVYTQGSSASAKATAEQLEKYLYVVRALSGSLKKPDSPLKLRVFLQPDTRGVQALMPNPGEDVAGFYHAGMRGALFVGPRGAAGDGPFRLSTRQVMLHELTHHFAEQYFPAVYPVWYQEGLAEYYGSIRVGEDNVASLGGLQEDRLASFEGNRWLPVGDMLRAHGYGDVGELDLIYAEGWALVHYLSTTKARPGQLAAYLKAINAGTPYDEAARQAFGDLGKLDGELNDYVHRQRFQELVLPFKQLDPGPVAVRELGPAEDAMLLYDVRLTVGVPDAQAAALADQVEATAARFSDDPHALAILADAERLAGRAAGEKAAVARWAAVAPADGFALAAQARLAADALRAAHATDDGQWGAVRRLLVRANTAAPDQPRILAAYYESYARRDMLPPVAAQNALYHALEVLPQDDTLRYGVAADFEARGMIDEAIAIIKPAAYAVAEGSSAKTKRAGAGEGRGAGDAARQMLARLERKKAARPAA